MFRPLTECAANHLFGWLLKLVSAGLIRCVPHASCLTTFTVFPYFRQPYLPRKNLNFLVQRIAGVTDEQQRQAMAPDINSMPSSPRLDRTSRASSNAASRRASQQMPPPPAPAATLPQNPQAQAHRSPVISSNEHIGVPLRHPRPLTAAELYLECEKEQEAVVSKTDTSQRTNRTNQFRRSTASLGN